MGGFAVLFRLLLLDTAPSLSDDIYRYLWDGRVQAAGGNPYAQAPDAASLEGLRDEDWSRINHPELVTVYPPVAQWFFLAAHLVWPGVTGLKAALVLCDLLLIAVLWRLLQARGQRPERALLYAWHPLPVIEIAGNGHVDVLGVTLMMSALLFLVVGRRHGAVLTLTAAVLAKAVPVLCLAAFWRHWAPPDSRGWRRWLDPWPRWPLVWVPAGVAAACLPYADAGAATWSGLRTFAVKWRHNDSLYGLVYSLIADPRPGWEWDDGALLAARWICLGALAAVTVAAAACWRDPVLGAAAAMAALLLLSPVVHPWYLLWVLAFVPMHPAPPLVAFSWLAFLGYQVLVPYRSSGVWQPGGVGGVGGVRTRVPAARMGSRAAGGCAHRPDMKPRSPVRIFACLRRRHFPIPRSAVIPGPHRWKLCLCLLGLAGSACTQVARQPQQAASPWWEGAGNPPPAEEVQQDTSAATDAGGGMKAVGPAVTEPAGPPRPGAGQPSAESRAEARPPEPASPPPEVVKAQRQAYGERTKEDRERVSRSTSTPCGASSRACGRRRASTWSRRSPWTACRRACTTTWGSSTNASESGRRLAPSMSSPPGWRPPSGCTRPTSATSAGPRRAPAGCRRTASTSAACRAPASAGAGPPRRGKRRRKGDAHREHP